MLLAAGSHRARRPSRASADATPNCLITDPFRRPQSARTSRPVAGTRQLPVLRSRRTAVHLAPPACNTGQMNELAGWMGANCRQPHGAIVLHRAAPGRSLHSAAVQSRPAADRRPASRNTIADGWIQPTRPGSAGRLAIKEIMKKTSSLRNGDDDGKDGKARKEKRLLEWSLSVSSIRAALPGKRGNSGDIFIAGF